MQFLRRMNLARAAQLTTVWGVIFAVVHAYWAAGGAVGTNGDPADTPGAQSYIAFIAAVGLAGAAVAGGLARGSRRRTLIMLSRAGGAALLLGARMACARGRSASGANGGPRMTSSPLSRGRRSRQSP